MEMECSSRTEVWDIDVQTSGKTGNWMELSDACTADGTTPIPGIPVVPDKSMSDVSIGTTAGSEHSHAS